VKRLSHGNAKWRRIQRRLSIKGKPVGWKERRVSAYLKELKEEKQETGEVI
jgi:hypothetical protein